MNSLKKIISLFLIVLILGANMTFASTNYGSLYKDLILTKNELKETKNGEKYAKQLDTFIENYKDNEKILNKLEKRTNESMNKLEYNNSKEYTQIKIIVKYINLHTKIAIKRLNEQNLIEIKEEIEEKKDEMLTSTLTESETEIVNEHLVNIQLNLLNAGIDNLKVLTEEFEKLANYEEKGNFNMNFDYNVEGEGNINANLGFIDYISKASNFDSQVSGQVEGSFNFDEIGGKKMNLELSSFIDFISKDGNMYILLENLNISEENIDDAKELIEKIKEIASENKYIKYDDKNTKEALNILQALTPNKILASGQAILEEPMFKAYKKVEDKYYLVPTKYACDKMKELGNKFDPFNGTSCSDSQYESIIDELSEVGNIYMIIGDNTTLGFEGIKDNYIDALEGYITFSDTSVEELKFEIQPNQIQSPNEFMDIEYIKNNKLSFNLYADSGDISFKLDSLLDQNNKFTSIDYSGQAVSSYDEFYSNLTLEDRQITGGFEYYPGQYDWETGKYIRDEHITGTIYGSTDYKNELDNLTLEYVGENNEDGEYLNGSLGYDNGNFSFENNYTVESFKSNIELSGEWDNNDKVITELDYSLSISAKEREWDSVNYEYIYNGDFEEYFNSNISLNNKTISGQTVIKDEGVEMINITHSGEFEKEYFEFNNNFTINEDLLNNMFGYSKDARNSKRISDLANIAVALELASLKIGKYPTQSNFKETTERNLFNNTKDPSGNIEIDGCKFGYLYELSENSYSLSACLENNDNTYEIYRKGDEIKKEDLIESFYIDGYTTWEIQEPKDETQNTGGDLNIKIDTRNNDNNINVYFDFDMNEKIIINFELDNISEIEYGDVEIVEPDEEDTIDSSEIFDNSGYDYYY